ncbi:LPS translocon maturation chaperone LptM [Hyphobacterium marinum]|uniref:Lipoprotein n=1 Tax=Hyphobacterium marinum TaxID=3116574 RepID=A0ABU7LXR3_9PROT|nr:lipoprotein [Hyphobacterium sp. Y6023]MEE2566331.1 lipoprotein [Hyphobacterium sp. Y6023]
MKRFACLVLALGALALAGCGMRGDLDRPPPMWGDPPPADSPESRGASGV